MRTCVSLLRGINVGGNNKIKMQELAAAYEELGFQQVRWYIQSGNMVFDAPGDEAKPDLVRMIEAKINEKFGLKIPVIVIEADDFKRSVRESPFADREPDKSVIVFLHGDTDAWTGKARMQMADGEELVVTGDVAYAFLPKGIGRSKVANVLVSAPPKGAKATMRNWRTVNKIVELIDKS